MLSDPGSQASEWIEWPSTDRDAASDMDYDRFFEPWRKRGRYLRTRACPGDEMSSVPVTAGAEGVWIDQSGTSRFWFPSWAQRLVMVMNMRITGGGGDPESSNLFKLRARFGSPGSYAYSSEPSVFIACEVGFRNFGYPPELASYCKGPAPDADDSNNGSFSWYVKRMLFDVPPAMRGTEQPFIYQVQTSFDVGAGARFRNDGVERPHCGWYLIAREEAA